MDAETVFSHLAPQKSRPYNLQRVAIDAFLKKRLAFKPSFIIKKKYPLVFPHI